MENVLRNYIEWATQRRALKVTYGEFVSPNAFALRGKDFLIEVNQEEAKIRFTTKNEKFFIDYNILKWDNLDSIFDFEVDNGLFDIQFDDNGCFVTDELIEEFRKWHYVCQVLQGKKARS